MRYRAKKDFIATDLQGTSTLVAQGDKVFVQQLTNGWEVYSFYSRKSLGWFDSEGLEAAFGPESEFQRSPRDDRFKGRKFGKYLGSKALIGLLTLLPFIGIAQVNPVVWDWKAVRVDATHFEFQIKALIAKGWWIYAPNRPQECPYSPIVTFERSPVMKPIERITVLEYLSYANNETTEGNYPPLCPIPQYRTSVIFMQLFKMPIDSSGTVRGQITFQAMSRYFTGPPTTVDFELHVGAEPMPVGIGKPARIITTYPKGVFRKTWWFMRHPFGPYYISKKYYP